VERVGHEGERADCIADNELLLDQRCGVGRECLIPVLTRKKKAVSMMSRVMMRADLEKPMVAAGAVCTRRVAV
jgi:hypothetical protein